MTDSLGSRDSLSKVKRDVVEVLRSKDSPDDLPTGGLSRETQVRDLERGGG